MLKFYLLSFHVANDLILAISSGFKLNSHLKLLKTALFFNNLNTKTSAFHINN